MNYLVRYLKLFKRGWLESKLFQFIVIFLFLTGFYAVSPWRVVMVGTPSIQMGFYYLNGMDHSRKRFSSYCFDNYRPEWVRSELNIMLHQISCKSLLGLPGDFVRVEGNDVVISYVDADALFGSKAKELRFERMTQVRGYPVDYVNFEGEIPEGQYYFGSDFPQGWDSRYLGLIKNDLVLGRAKMIHAF